MSFYYGVFSFSGTTLEPCREALKAASSTFPADFTLSEFGDERLLLFHGDLRVLPEAGFRSTPEGVAALAGALVYGSPHQPGDDPAQPELSRALRALVRGEILRLREANGTFAISVYDPAKGRLILAADSLGARPLYYAQHDGRLFFSTSLSVLRRIVPFPLVADLGSYQEQEAICYPLGPRTLYSNVRVLVAGEALIAGTQGTRTTLYHSWTEVRPEQASIEDHARNCLEAFRQALKDRVTSDRTQRALLSGGLDSRLICAELREMGLELEAWNLSPEGYQDQVYAREFADRAGITLHSVPWRELPVRSAGENTAVMLTEAVSRVAPAAVFSGDGGGETFGFLLLDAKSADLLHEGKWDAGIQQYLAKKAQPSKSLYTDAVYRQVQAVLLDRVNEEMRSIGAASDKTLQIFALINDLRCHLHHYFSEISTSRTELLLPFYDRRVIEAVLRVPSPLSPLLGHRFYNRVLQYASPLISSAPWQTYPGNDPCPVQGCGEPPKDQWSRPSRVGDVLAKRCLKLLLQGGISPALRSTTVATACILHMLRRTDYTYLFKTTLNVSELAGPRQTWVARDDSPVTRSTLAGMEETVR